MSIVDVKENWLGKVQEIKLSDKFKIGGETGFPCYKFEAEFPNRPIVALEITDIYPREWQPCLKESIGEDKLRNPVEWAKKCITEYNADLIFFNMIGTHQDKENISPEQAVETLNEILTAVDAPVIVKSAGNFEKQNKVISRCAELAKSPVILGSAVQENYRTITAAALAGNHILIAESPIDVNIAKQMNILITQMNFPIEKIIMDPLTGGLGYGLEYTYSVMERIRLQTFQDDKIMTSPMICFVGQEVWKIKEIKLTDEKFGSSVKRGINWEIATSISLLLTGANIITVRHPESLKQIKRFLSA